MYKSRASAERAYRGYLGATYGESAIARAIESVDQHRSTKRTSKKDSGNTTSYGP